MPKPPVPRDRELRQLFGQLCDQAADVAASFRACGCSEDVRSGETDDERRGVNALRRDLIAIRQQLRAGSVGDDLTDEALKRTLARLESQVSALDQRTKAPSDEPAENTRTVGTQTELAIPESRESALDGATTTPIDEEAESASNIGTQKSSGEERTDSPTNTEDSVDPARGPLTLMRLPPEVRSLIWWEVLRPEGGFVPIEPWIVGQDRFLDKGRIRARRMSFHRARTAVIDRKLNPFSMDNDPFSLINARSWKRPGEHLGWTRGWSLLDVNTQIYEEAEAAYWRRVIADGLMLSFGCGTHRADYWGLAVARTFLNDFTPLYLQKIQRIHIDLRRLDHDDGPNGFGGQAFVAQRAGVLSINFVRYLGTVLNNISTKLTGLRHLSLTFGGWVPDVRHTPWIENLDYFVDRLQSSEQWVTRLRNITGLTRLRLRVMYAPRDPDTINARLDQDPGVQRTIHFLSMLRGSMLINGEALGVGHMRAWANKRKLEFTTAERFRIVVQCDDSWDEEKKEHCHYVEDDEYDPIGGLNNFTDKFRWDPDADS